MHLKGSLVIGGERYDDPPMRILFLIARQCNMLLQVKELRTKGYDNKTMAAKIGAAPFVVGKYLNQAAKFGIDYTVRYFRELML